MRLLVLLVCLLVRGAAAGELLVEALLPGVAVVQIDGARVTLRAGQSHGGVKLVAADSREAHFEIDGVSQRLGVSQRVSASFTAPDRRSVTVPRNAQLQYRVTAELNGVRMPVIVDTGANIVALNARHALALGIGPDEGVAMEVQTAGAIMPARRVRLDSVAVGGIRVQSVDATVLDGDLPHTVLLGMSFLQHVELEERGGVLTLTAKW